MHRTSPPYLTKPAAPSRTRGFWGDHAGGWRLGCWFVGLLALAGVPAVARAQSGYTFEECARATKRSLRDELNKVAQRASQNEDFDPAVVEVHWYRLGLDAVLEQEVKRAVEVVSRETGYMQRLSSGWSAEQARALTLRVAREALGGEAFREGIGQLAQALSAEVAAAMELASARSASATLSCMQSFMGARYPKAMSEMFRLRVQPRLDAVRPEQFVSVPDVLDMRSASLAGAGSIVTAQVVRQLASRVRQRVAGRIMVRILGRAGTTLVPVVGWVAGLGLIGMDLYRGAEGALPQIQEALTSPQAAADLREALAEVTADAVERELPVVARQVANDAYESWQHLRTRLRGVLELAERNPDFKELLAQTPAEQLEDFASQVKELRETLGPERFAQGLQDGSFVRVMRSPAAARALLMETRSFAETLAWADLAGSRLSRVVDFGLHRLRTPEDLDERSVGRLLLLPDAERVAKLLRLRNATVQPLLQLPTEQLAALLAQHDLDGLRWLAGYLTRLAADTDRSALVARVLHQPELLAKLKNECVRQVLVTSDDLEGMLDFIGEHWMHQTLSALGGLLTGSATATQLMWCVRPAEQEAAAPRAGEEQSP